MTLLPKLCAADLDGALWCLGKSDAEQGVRAAVETNGARYLKARETKRCSCSERYSKCVVHVRQIADSL